MAYAARENSIRDDRERVDSGYDSPYGRPSVRAERWQEDDDGYGREPTPPRATPQRRRQGPAASGDDPWADD